MLILQAQLDTSQAQRWKDLILSVEEDGDVNNDGKKDSTDSVS